MPLPFMRSMGVGGLLVPLFSIAASATFLPALLAVMGTKVNRLRVIPRRILENRAAGRPGAWSRLARSIMRRPVLYLVLAGGLMVGLALPALGLHLTSGDNRGVPLTQRVDARASRCCEDTLGPGALAPNQLVIDTGGRAAPTLPRWSPPRTGSSPSCAATPRSSPRPSSRPRCCRRGRAGAGAEREASLVDPSGAVAQVRVAGQRRLRHHRGRRTWSTESVTRYLPGGPLPARPR